MVGVHLVGGLLGHPAGRSRLAAPEAPAAQSTACSTAADSTSCGARQSVPFAVLAYSAVGTTILALIVKYDHRAAPLSEEDEVSGIDEAEHAETGIRSRAGWR